MWHFLLAAAVAGSTGLVAKHLFNPFSQKQRDKSPTGIEQERSTPLANNGFLEAGYDSNCDDGIFRFSSSGSSGETVSRSLSKVKSRFSSKKKGFGGGGGGGSRIGRRSGNGVEVSRRRVSLCLKKRRTGKNTVSSKDSSVFSWGLGVGIMYMMSAGKNEISKLNTAMDETAKLVQELKDELYRRKSMRNPQVPASAYEVTAYSKKISGKDCQIALNTSGTGSRGSHYNKLHGFPLSDDGEYASSVLTEEPEPDVVEMDRLEAELESELQKLPWSCSETSNLEGNKPDMAEELVKEFHGLVEEGSESYQCGGIPPSELDKKLCHLLIEQQESQIEELESELHTAQSKLQQKEVELQALKDCVRRLTEFSLSNPSDDEAEPKRAEDLNDSWNQQNNTDPEPRKPMVGMKRPIDSE